MKKDTVWTYTSPMVGYFTRQDRYVLYLERRSRFWDFASSVLIKPFKKTGYSNNLWGHLWEWSYHKAEDKTVVYASFNITKDEAERISPGIGDTLDLTWPGTQSSDEL